MCNFSLFQNQFMFLKVKNGNVFVSSIHHMTLETVVQGKCCESKSFSSKNQNREYYLNYSQCLRSYTVIQCKITMAVALSDDETIVVPSSLSFISCTSLLSKSQRLLLGLLLLLFVDVIWVTRSIFFIFSMTIAHSDVFYLVGTFIRVDKSKDLY